MRATEIRRGNVIQYEKITGTVIEVNHRTPGNKRGFVQVKYRDIETGNMYNAKITSSESVERVYLDNRSFQYLYPEGDSYVFMDNETYEQIPLQKDILEGVLPFLVDNGEVSISMMESRPVAVELPSSVLLIVTETEEVARGDTANALTKDATTETGLVVKVPAYIKIGEKIRVKTETGEFQEREK
jgi:elongation factor P